MSILFEIIDNKNSLQQSILIRRPKNVETMHSILTSQGATFSLMRDTDTNHISVIVSLDEKTIAHDAEPTDDMKSPDVLQAIDACISDAFYLFMNEKEHQKVN